jgi:hypothetical protein
MEKELRKKALAGLAILLLCFVILSLFLTTIEPENIAVAYTYVDYQDSELDSLNYTELQAMFYQPSFLENYSVGPAAYEHYSLEIIPKDNPDIVIYLGCYEGDIFFNADGYMMVGAFFNDGDWDDMEKAGSDELTQVLGHIGRAELVHDLYWDDYDFSMIAGFFHTFAFLGIISLIIVYLFMMFFKDGWLIKNFKLIDSNVDILLGISLIFFMTLSIVFWLWLTASDGASAERTAFCLVPIVIFAVLGAQQILSGMRRMDQSESNLSP